MRAKARLLRGSAGGTKRTTYYHVIAWKVLTALTARKDFTTLLCVFVFERDHPLVDMIMAHNGSGIWIYPQ